MSDQIELFNEEEALKRIKDKIPNEKKWEKTTKVLVSGVVLALICFYLNIIPTEYNIFFFILSVVTGFYYFKEKKSWRQFLEKTPKNEWVRPWWLNWTAGIFPMILGVFILRGFFGEFFKIPTGSMIPNIMIGEVALTNKVYYDFKLPIVEKSLFKIHDVKRGDVVVFRYPLNKTVYYVKRFVGLPGDTIEYDNQHKTLYINGKEMTKQKINTITAGNKTIEEYEENLMGLKHRIWLEPESYTIPNPNEINFQLHETCSYTIQKIKCVVPADHYFAMGDNRDNSADSRFWGFVPKENVVGRAEMIIYSPVDITRVGWIK